ncbi:MAG: lipase family alpha/beta hydrolase [Spirochaeta sp.]
MKTRFTVLAALLSVVTLFSCANDARQNQDLFSDMRYPILLVDGLARRGDIGLLATFDDAQEHLHGLGARVYMNTRDAFGSIESNANLLAKDVDRVLAESGADRLHIIAHSKGGLDSRYLVTELEYHDRVATLVTISTPHRGTAIADYIADNVGEAEDVLANLVNWFARLLGDQSPNAEQAAEQLTRDYMQEFNRTVVNHPDVRYLSYASTIDGEYPNPIWARMARELGEEEGPNDGLVSVRSARWGEFMGVVNQRYGSEQVSHRDIVGMNDVWNNMGFPYLRFIVDVALQLETE